MTNFLSRFMKNVTVDEFIKMDDYLSLCMLKALVILVLRI
jgi:hypothetical protein